MSNYKEFIPRTIYYNKNCIILGENHTNTIFIEKNKAILLKYLELIKYLASKYGIYFEGKAEPVNPVSSFISKYEIKGLYNTWETNAVLSEGVLILDLFGGEFSDIYRQVNITSSKNTVKDIVIDNSEEYSCVGKVPKELFEKLFSRGDKKLKELLEATYSKENFKKAHEYGQSLSFDKPGSYFYKLQIKQNSARGLNLKKLAFSKGGIFFCGADHINAEYAKIYGLL